ncbi:Outer membrane protein beta-barrel domain-containing protein [Draconibacterium orientale]|uniref:Outer membrane protein beta-barrel domain-containing protein n=1 Tax=Draconibacterium orientale TaxID=1168034 RepID=A0A1I0IWK1_9BACT|nr:porin family protein [Draconibacterium orientale]SEU01017.1 Outer membrane protein beta-barrel domain-containing protein [Draconibacterium orientale]
MKTLVQVLTAILLSTITSTVFAQTIGIKAGYTLSDMLIKEDGEIMNEALNMRSGLHFGPTFEWGIGEGAGIETALLLTTKGIKMNESESFESIAYSINSKVNLWYLDIPVFGKLYTNLNGIKVYGMFGPYIGIGLNGKTKVEETNGTENFSEEWDIVWGANEDDDLKRLGLGLAVGGGIEVSSFVVEFTSHFGLNNISPQADDDVVARNRSFMFSLGYKFRK